MLLVPSKMQTHANDLREALETGDLVRAQQLAHTVSRIRAAAILAEAPPSSMMALLQTVGWERAGRIAAYFPPELAVKVLEDLDDSSARALLSEMPAEKIADLLPYLPDPLQRRLFEGLDPELLGQVQTLASYPEGTAGAIMSPYFLSVEHHLTVADVVEAVRSAEPDLERTAYVFVVNAQSKKLAGVVSLRELLINDPLASVADVMTTEVFAVHTGEDAAEAAHRIRSRRLKMLPVVDAQDALAGVISINQAMELLAHEVADEFVAISAGSPDESFYTPPREAVKKRLPWMAVNIFLNLGAVAVISSFEDTIVQVAILAAFLPMITDMGGNVGIQALSVSIRSMALGEARLRDFWKAVRKEVIIGLCNGLALGVLFTGVAYVLQGNMILGVVAGIALACNVLLAGVVGGTIPFLIKRLGKDPAMMTGPILTTITDITGVTVYLGLATIFLSSLMAGG